MDRRTLLQKEKPENQPSLRRLHSSYVRRAFKAGIEGGASNRRSQARQGTLFEAAIAPSSWTLPSFGSIVTGLYPSVLGAEDRRLDTRHTTIGEAFLSLGYRTGAFSANTYFFCRRMGFGRGFLRFSEVSPSPTDQMNRLALARYMLPGIHKIGISIPLPSGDAAHINGSFLNWLDARPGKPFFAMLNYFDTHAPYFPPGSYRNVYSDPMPPDKIKEGWLRNQPPIRTPAGIRTWLNAYDGSIRYVDDQILALLNELRKRGLDANTLVVIAADHGESFGEHGLISHNNGLYIETLHVPLIFYWPGKVPQSLRIKHPVSLVSLPATLLDLAGKRIDPSFEGPSLTPFLKPEGVASWADPLSELVQFPYSFTFAGDPSLYGSMASVIEDRWHYIIHEYTGEELYDWIADPREINDLSATPAAQEVLVRLRNLVASREGARNK